MVLHKSTFWEYDISKIDVKRDLNVIIPRIAMRGTVDELRELRKFYGDKKIKEVLLHTRYLDNRTLHFFSNLYQIPLEKFRCYILKQSSPQHWDL